MWTMWTRDRPQDHKYMTVALLHVCMALSRWESPARLFKFWRWSSTLRTLLCIKPIARASPQYRMPALGAYRVRGQRVGGLTNPKNPLSTSCEKTQGSHAALLVGLWQRPQS